MESLKQKLEENITAVQSLYQRAASFRRDPEETENKLDDMDNMTEASFVNQKSVLRQKQIELKQLQNEKIHHFSSKEKELKELKLEDELKKIQSKLQTLEQNQTLKKDVRILELKEKFTKMQTEFQFYLEQIKEELKNRKMKEEFDHKKQEVKEEKKKEIIQTSFIHFEEFTKQITDAIGGKLEYSDAYRLLEDLNSKKKQIIPDYEPFEYIEDPDHLLNHERIEQMVQKVIREPKKSNAKLLGKTLKTEIKKSLPIKRNAESSLSFRNDNKENQKFVKPTKPAEIVKTKESVKSSNQSLSQKENKQSLESVRIKSSTSSLRRTPSPSKDAMPKFYTVRVADQPVFLRRRTFQPPIHSEPALIKKQPKSNSQLNSLQSISTKPKTRSIEIQTVTEQSIPSTSFTTPEPIKTQKDEGIQTLPILVSTATSPLYQPKSEPKKVEPEFKQPLVIIKPQKEAPPSPSEPSESLDLSFEQRMQEWIQQQVLIRMLARKKEPPKPVLLNQTSSVSDLLRRAHLEESLSLKICEELLNEVVNEELKNLLLNLIREENFVIEIRDRILNETVKEISIETLMEEVSKLLSDHVTNETVQDLVRDILNELRLEEKKPEPAIKMEIAIQTTPPPKPKEIIKKLSSSSSVLTTLLSDGEIMTDFYSDGQIVEKLEYRLIEETIKKFKQAEWFKDQSDSSSSKISLIPSRPSLLPEVSQQSFTQSDGELQPSFLSSLHSQDVIRESKEFTKVIESPKEALSPPQPEAREFNQTVEIIKQPDFKVEVAEVRPKSTEMSQTTTIPEVYSEIDDAALEAIHFDY